MRAESGARKVERAVFVSLWWLEHTRNVTCGTFAVLFTGCSNCKHRSGRHSYMNRHGCALI